VSIFKRSKTETIAVHASPAEKQLLQDAARTLGKNLDEFLLDAGVVAANKALAGRRQFVLDGEQLDAFKQALERPAKAKPATNKVPPKSGKRDE
jgi:uncharacterized protein (DUF1778 family)